MAVLVPSEVAPCLKVRDLNNLRNSSTVEPQRLDKFHVSFSFVHTQNDSSFNSTSSFHSPTRTP